MYTVIRQYQVGPEDEAEVNELVSGDFSAQLQTIPGFINYTWLKGEDGLMFSIGVFSDKESAEESNHMAASIVRERLAGKPIRPIGAIQGEAIFHKGA